MAVLDWLGMGIAGRGRMNKKAIVAIALGLGGLWLLMAKAQKAGETQTEGGFFLPDVFGFMKASFDNVMSDIGFRAMTVSDSFLEFMKTSEALSLKAYPRPEGGGYCIGYGHNIESGEEYLLKGISKQKADELFIDDIEQRQGEMAKKITVKLTAAQYESVLDYWYNTGTAAHTRVVALLNRGNWAGFIAELQNNAEFNRRNGMGGNVKRRAIDIAAFKATEFMWPRSKQEIEIYGDKYNYLLG